MITIIVDVVPRIQDRKLKYILTSPFFHLKRYVEDESSKFYLREFLTD